MLCLGLYIFFTLSLLYLFRLIQEKRLYTRRTLCSVFIIFLHALGRLTCSGINTLPSFPGAPEIPSSPGFVGEGVFREFGVVHSFEVVDPVL